MRKSIALILALAIGMAAFISTVHADDDTAPSGVKDTLAEELGLQETEAAVNPDAETAALLTELIVSVGDAEASPNSRLVLERVYDSLKNNIDDSSMDASAKTKLDGWLEAMEPLRLTASEREKYQSLFQYNQAVQLKAVVDDPLALLSFSRSYNLKDVGEAVIMLEAESPESYTAFQNPVDSWFLQLNQALEEEEKTILDTIRTEAQEYLKDFVKSKELPEQYLLSEETVQKYAEWKNSSDISGRIQFLEENQESLSEYAGCWLLSAQSYYENGEYEKCLSAIHTYEGKQKPAYLKDCEYARVIPRAILSLIETVRVVDTRVESIAACVENLIRNTDADDWALRYFAAMCYMEISRSSDNVYMKARWRNNAYIISRSIVKSLTAMQQESSRQYLANLIQEETPEGASPERKKKIRELNTVLKEDRKTSLPPVSQPLLLASDLLKAFMERESSDEEGRKQAEAALYPDNGPVFLNRVIEKQYRNEPAEEMSSDEITLDKKKLSVPADLPAYDYTITVVADNGTDTWTFADWEIDNIKRNDPDDIHSFIAEMTSERYSNFKFEENMEINIEVIPTGIVECEPLKAKYRTVPAKFLFFFNTVKLERAD